MNCRDFREFIDSFLSDELLTETNHDILRHLEECGDCRSEIEARRLVRTRLRSAVRVSPEFEIRQGFAKGLGATLRSSVGIDVHRRPTFFFLNRSRLAFAAVGLLVVVTIGFLLSIRYSGDQQIAEARPLLASSLPANHIVNIADGDHDVCAVKHNSDKPPVSLASISPEFRGLAQVVSGEINGLLTGYSLIGSHSCRYKGTKFSHVILRENSNLLSVLVTDSSVKEHSADRIESFRSDKYRIARFDVKKRTVFVVSQLDNDRNSKVASALRDPLTDHFARTVTDRVVQSMLLNAF